MTRARRPGTRERLRGPRDLGDSRIARVTILVATLAGVARADEPVPESGPPAPAPTPSVPGDRTAERPVPDESVRAPAPLAFAAWSPERLALDLRLYSSARWTKHPGDDLTELRLDRGEVGVRVGITKQAAAELRLEAVRSAGEGGTLGIDGDSMVARIKVAQVGGTVDAGPVRLDGALGFVRDPWLATLETDYSLLPLSRTASERLLDWPSSDLSAEVRASLGPARLSLAVGNGEGLRYPERNSGKTTTVVLEIVPLHTHDLRIAIAGVGRDGSIGAASVRDRRAGGGATVVTPIVRGGVEAVRVWGLMDRGEVTGTALAGWADVTPIPRLSLAARGATLGISGGRSSTVGGAIAVTPWPSVRGELRVWLAVDRQTSSGAASPLPGIASGDATLFMVIASAEAPFIP